MTHPASLARAADLLAAGTDCWRRCGVSLLSVEDVAAALDEAWEDGRRFAASQARLRLPMGGEHAEKQILEARRPE